MAHDAYVLSLQGKGDVVIDGLSGEQRFFLAFANRWRKLQTEDCVAPAAQNRHARARENIAATQCAMSMPGTRPIRSRQATSST